MCGHSSSRWPRRDTWAQLVGTWGRVGDEGGAAGYGYQTRGMLAGRDLGSGALDWGIAAGYTQSRVGFNRDADRGGRPDRRGGRDALDAVGNSQRDSVNHFTLAQPPPGQDHRLVGGEGAALVQLGPTDDDPSGSFLHSMNVHIGVAFQDALGPVPFRVRDRSAYS